MSPLKLDDLPPELLIHSWSMIEDFFDCAALFLASPRHGKTAIREKLANFESEAFRLALHYFGLHFSSKFRFPTVSLRSFSSRAPNGHRTLPMLEWIKKWSPENFIVCDSTSNSGSVDNFATWKLISSTLSPIPDSFLADHGNAATLQVSTHDEEDDATESGEAGEPISWVVVETLLRAWRIGSRQVHHYKGQSKEERKFKVQFDWGETQFFHGPRNNEAVYMTSFPDGIKNFYTGTEDKERLFMVETKDGNLVHYDGEKDVERMVLVEIKKTGEIQWFEGEAYKERLVKVFFPTTNTTQMYAGEQGKEKAVLVIDNSTNLSTLINNESALDSPFECDE